ncbi:MAG: ABC transporter ATP-binding protein [Desulfobacterales bacterium]
MTTTPLLEVQNLSHHFGKFQVLSRISLEIPAGALTALIGPNGAGKTTFYNLISGRFTPSEGRVVFNGRDITGLPAHRVATLGLVRSFQITNIFPALSVLDNVAVPLLLLHRRGANFWRPLTGEKAVYRQAAQQLERVGLAAAAHRPARELAYGDKRLVEMAIVLARDPKLVLLDEPTAGMNPEETDRMIRLIKTLADTSGTTFCLTEHDMKVVFAVASQIAVLHQGQLLAWGPPEKIRSDPKVRRAYLGGSLDA